MNKKKYFGFIFWIHLILVLIGYFSPILFDWRIIIFISILLGIQYKLLGGCILNKLQFNETKDITFMYPYLKMLGFKPNLEKLKFIIRYIVPLLLTIIAIILQEIISIKPLLI